MTPADELRDAVRQAADGTPYRVEATPDGFDLRIDLADARWWGPLGAAGRTKVAQHRVVLDDERRTFTLTDDQYDVSWQVAADGTGTREPRLLLAATGERTIGRSREVALERTWGGADPLGRPRPVVDLTFASTTGQTMIRDAAVELGWTERRGTAQRIGLVAGLAGVGIALLVMTVVVTLALTGGF